MGIAMREKLIELLAQVQYLGGLEEKIADYLIANDVTIATDNNVGDKLSPTDKDINVPSKWIPVTERLPEDDEVVLIACKIGKMFVGYHKHLFPGCEVWRILTARDSTKKITYTVTHWMPLPLPPEGE